MVKNHLKALAAPRNWMISRKNNIFVTRPYPGAHDMENSMPVLLVMKELAKIARTKKEIKFILQNNQVLVDGNRCHEEKMPIGFLDTLALPETKQYFRVSITPKGKITTIDIDAKEAGFKIVRLERKTMIKGGKIQLGFNDGRTLITDKTDAVIGDTMLLEVPKQKIQKTFKLVEGAPAILIGGKHRGQLGKIVSIKESMITYESEKGTFETLKKYAFVTGKDKAEIKIQ